MKVLVLRPQPGADETADRAIAQGLEPVTAPLFTIRATDWDAPDPAGIEAVMLTSANAARCGGEQLGAFAGLPCYAVGNATAAAALEAGFGDVRAGRSAGEALIAMMAGDGIIRALHLCGRDHIALDHPQIALTRRCVYSAEAVGALPAEARGAMGHGAVALLHSSRAARLFGELTDAAGIPRATLSIGAISQAVAAAAGNGWRSKGIAPKPTDNALLELAAQLCQTGGVRWEPTDEC